MDVQSPNTNLELKKLITTGRLQLFFQGISTACMIIMTVVVIGIALKVVPKITTAIDNVNQVAVSAQNSLKDADEMIQSITTASENMNTLINENAEELTQSTKSMSEIDFEGLNQAIRDLQDAVGPVANFFNKFK